MVVVSQEFLKSMGFVKEGPGNVIRATFQSITVFEVSGIFIEDEAAIHASGAVAEVEFRIAMARSVNAATQALVGENFVDDEDVWKKDKGSQSPFLLVALMSPTQFEAVDPPTNRRHADQIVTYEAFAGAKSELAALRARAMPQLQFALSSQLSAAIANPVSLKKVDSTDVGRTEQGVALHDVLLRLNGQATVAFNRTSLSLQPWVNRAVSNAPKVRQRSARPFAAALAEEDHFKRFLYFFLSLEIETNAVFSSIKTGTGVDKIMSNGSGANQHAMKLLRRQAKELTNLADKFIWCAFCKWPNVTDDDIETFQALKKARDDIAHGNTHEPPAGSAHRAHRLALKIIFAGD